MKYVRFSTNDQVMFGVLDGDQVHQLDGDFLKFAAKILQFVYQLHTFPIL